LSDAFDNVDKLSVSGPAIRWSDIYPRSHTQSVHLS